MAGQVHAENRSFAQSKVAWWIEGTGLGEDPAFCFERKAGYMTPCAPNFGKLHLAAPDGSLDQGVPRYHPPWNSQSCLKECDGSDVRSRHLIDEAIPVQVRARTEALRRLNAVMVIKGVVSELTKRDDSTGLMEWPDDQAAAA